MEEQLKQLSEVKKKKDEMDKSMLNEIDTFSKQLNDKLIRMISDFEVHQKAYITEYRELKQIINAFKVENITMFEDTLKLQERIEAMEITIGKNLKN